MTPGKSTTENKSHELAWQECLKIIKDNVNPQSYKTWFEPIKALKLQNKVLTIQVRSQFFYEWLEEHYVQLLHKTLKKVIGPTAKLEYNIIIETSGHDQMPYTINLPTGSSGKPVQNELGMPVNLDTPIDRKSVV